jgi:hypothetical protein
MSMRRKQWPQALEMLPKSEQMVPWGEAEANLRQAARLDPGLGSSHYQLARVYHSERKYAQALGERCGGQN